MRHRCRANVSVKFLIDPKPIGLYLHIPFCRKKCAYCDFYSAVASDILLDRYAQALKEAIQAWGGKINRPICTVYFGGGTPALLANRLFPVMKVIQTNFHVLPDAEITMEINPSDEAHNFLETAKCAGVNRLSIGAQSGEDKQLVRLGRTHTAAQTLGTVAAARRLGFENLSLDLMIGLPFSNLHTLQQDVEFVLSAKPEHLSVYLLKIEPHTRFWQEQHSLSLPGDDDAAEQYLAVCEELKRQGYRHYEISNFCKQGFESRHNLIYWNAEEYLGIGPAAHSFLEGRRFYYEKNLKKFLNGALPIPDGEGGGRDEYIMLKLRLADGLSFREYQEKFGEEAGNRILPICRRFAEMGLMTICKDRIALTDRGMLVSNRIITECLL